MENISQWVGIDISKATLDVCLRPLGKAMKVTNTEEDISRAFSLGYCSVEIHPFLVTMVLSPRLLSSTATS